MNAQRALLLPLVALVSVLAGVASAVVSAWAAVALVLGVAALAWTFASPFHATLVFLVVLVTRPADMVPALEVLKPAKVLALGALVTFLLGRLLSGDFSRSRTPQGTLMLCLTFATFASALTGSDRAASTTLFTDVFVKILILFVLVVHLVDRPARLVMLHVTMSLATSGLAAYALHAKLTGQATIEGSRAGFVGLLGDPNDLALVLVMYVPFLVESVIATRGGRRFLISFQLLILLSGLASTQSRGGFLGLGLGLAVAFHDRGTRRLKLLLAPFLAIGIVGIGLLAGVAERQSGGMEGEGIDESAQGRLDAWLAGGRMVRRHPLLGVGLGRFADNFEGYASNAVIWGKHETHNAYIKAAAETGILGFVPFVGLVVATLRTGYRLRKLERADTGLERAARLALLPSMAGFSLTAFFLSQCWGWFFYILFATGAAMYGLYGLSDLKAAVRGSTA